MTQQGWDDIMKNGEADHIWDIMQKVLMGTAMQVFLSWQAAG